MKIKFDGTDDSLETGIKVKGRKWKPTLKQKIKMFRFTSVFLDRPSKYWSNKRIASFLKANELRQKAGLCNAKIPEAYFGKKSITDKKREAIEKCLIKKYCK